MLAPYIREKLENTTSGIVNEDTEDLNLTPYGYLCSSCSCLMSILCFAGIVMFFVQLFSKN